MANRTDKEAYSIHGTNPQARRGEACRSAAAAAAAFVAAAAAWRLRPHPFPPPTSHSQNLIEYISRQKIYDSLYWKQECFGLSAEKLVDKAVELKEVRCCWCWDSLHVCV